MSSDKLNKVMMFQDEDEVEEDYDVFEKALKKKQFEGKKGHLLMELQASYKNDNRFMFDKKFKDDVDARKVSNNVKKMTHAFDRRTTTYNSHQGVHFKAQDIVDEKNKNLSILSQVISNSEFLGTIQPKKYSNPKKFLIKRFDPKSNLGKDLIIKKEERDTKMDTNRIKLQKGLNNNDENNMLPADTISNLKKRDKEKEISKVMNELHSELEPKVEIKFDSWKNIIKGKDGEGQENLTFSLFDGYVAKKTENNINHENKSEGKEKGKGNKIKTIQNFEPVKHKEKASLLFEPKAEKKATKEEVEEKEKTEKMLLKKKRNKEKKKLKEKQKKDEIKVAEKTKDDKVEKILKTELLKEFNTDKVDNYIRYVNLVREKKSVKNNKSNKE